MTAGDLRGQWVVVGTRPDETAVAVGPVYLYSRAAQIRDQMIGRGWRVEIAERVSAADWVKVRP
jgi:hypothetical protein